MTDRSVTFFPVGNGDTSLLRLGDGTTVLLDCNIRDVQRGVYDVRTHLLRTLKADEQGRPHLGAFVLTHPDEDHCRGFASAFYLGEPSDYADSDKKAGRIIVDELWFAPRIFNEYAKDLSHDAQAFRSEAQRRIDLYKKCSSRRSSGGNRLRVIGYSECDEVAGLEEILTIPGGTVALINGVYHTDFRFFVYAPIKRDTDAAETERNETSVVLQACFDVGTTKDAARIFFGGDTGCVGWERIVDVNKDDNLEWDLLLTPHHCSWKFFSAVPYDPQKPELSAKILHLLELKRGEAYVVASSKPIKDDGDNPPHYGAKKEYVKVVGSKRFLCTGEHPTEESPGPICFTMTPNGPVKDDLPGGGKASSSAAVKTVVTTPRTYG